MSPHEVRGRHLVNLPRLEAEVASSSPSAKDARARYVHMVADYVKRQMLVYEHWPQRRYDALGYTEEKVFTDMNA